MKIYLKSKLNPQGYPKELLPFGDHSRHRLRAARIQGPVEASIPSSPPSKEITADWSTIADPTQLMEAYLNSIAERPYLAETLELKLLKNLCRLVAPAKQIEDLNSLAELLEKGELTIGIGRAFTRTDLIPVPIQEILKVYTGISDSKEQRNFLNGNFGPDSYDLGYGLERLSQMPSDKLNKLFNNPIVRIYALADNNIGTIRNYLIREGCLPPIKRENTQAVPIQVGMSPLLEASEIVPLNLRKQNTKFPTKYESIKEGTFFSIDLNKSKLTATIKLSSIIQAVAEYVEILQNYYGSNVPYKKDGDGVIAYTKGPLPLLVKKALIAWEIKWKKEGLHFRSQAFNAKEDRISELKIGIALNKDRTPVFLNADRFEQDFKAGKLADLNLLELSEEEFGQLPIIPSTQVTNINFFSKGRQIYDVMLQMPGNDTKNLQSVYGSLQELFPNSSVLNLDKKNSVLNEDLFLTTQGNPLSDDLTHEIMKQLDRINAPKISLNHGFGDKPGSAVLMVSLALNPQEAAVLEFFIKRMHNDNILSSYGIAYREVGTLSLTEKTQIENLRLGLYPASEQMKKNYQNITTISDETFSAIASKALENAKHILAQVIQSTGQAALGVKSGIEGVVEANRQMIERALDNNIGLETVAIRA